MTARGRSPTLRIWRLGVLTAIAMAATVVALRSFPPPPPLACPSDAPPDTSYVARLAPEARSGVHDYQVVLSRQGLPIGGVQVCLRAAMTDMPDMQVKVQPPDLGRPEQVTINFEMAGSWGGTVMLVRPHLPPVAVPFYLAVD